MNSVWPTNVGSVSCVASLFIGIVTMPGDAPGERVASVAGGDVRRAPPRRAARRARPGR